MSTVLIVGGTHGNERTGIELVRHWRHENPAEIERPGIKTELIIGNEEASLRHIRYVDHDLNRSFGVEETSIRRSSVEGQKMLTLREKYNQKDHFIIDMHSTASHMGISLIVLESLSAGSSCLKPPFSKSFLVAYEAASRINRATGNMDCRILLLPQTSPVLIGMKNIDGGVIIEVGPLVHGTVTQESFDQTRIAVKTILDVLNEMQDLSTKKAWESADDVDVWTYVKNIRCPNANYVLNPSLQGTDFQKISKDTCLWTNWTRKDSEEKPLASSTISDFIPQDIDAHSEVVLVFILEPAYQLERIGAMLVRKIFVARHNPLLMENF